MDKWNTIYLEFRKIFRTLTYTVLLQTKCKTVTTLTYMKRST